MKKVFALLLAYTSVFFAHGQPPTGCTMEEFAVFEERPAFIRPTEALDLIRGKKQAVLHNHTMVSAFMPMSFFDPFLKIKRKHFASKTTLIGGKVWWTTENYPVGEDIPHSTSSFLVVMIIFFLIMFRGGVSYLQNGGEYHVWSHQRTVKHIKKKVNEWRIRGGLFCSLVLGAVGGWVICMLILCIDGGSFAGDSLVIPVLHLMIVSYLGCLCAAKYTYLHFKYKERRQEKKLALM